MDDAKRLRMLLRVLRICPQLRSIACSENFLTPACFHQLRDLVLRAPHLRHLKMYLSSSERLFNEMFLELQRFMEDLIRSGS